MTVYLIQFLNNPHYLDFALAEFEALVKLAGVIDIDSIYRGDTTVNSSNSSSCSVRRCRIVDDNVFVMVTLPSIDVIMYIASRSMLIKSIYQLWSHGDNYQQLLDRLHTSMFACDTLSSSSPSSSSSSSVRSLISSVTDDASASYSITVESYNGCIPQCQQQTIRSKIDFLAFKGTVRLSHPVHSLYIIFDYTSSKSNREKSIDYSIEAEDTVCYLGSLVSSNCCTKDINRKYDLKRRVYVGPTSLDHTLAFILANIAGVTSSSVVLDPFVGTGSILVAASYHKSLCYGFDIDTRVLRGDMYAGTSTEVRRRDIVENFKEYELNIPELLRLDNHILHRHVAGHLYSNFYDAIITDPPYGIRAGGRKSGVKDTLKYDVINRDDHIPATQRYEVNEVMLDLLDNAANLLRVDGILVYLLPTPYDFTVELLPVHPCMQLMMTCEQRLSTRHGRHAVVMRKQCNQSNETIQEFSQYRNSVLSGNDDKFGMLMTKLVDALAPTAIDNESVVKIQSGKYLKRLEGKNKRRKATLEGRKYKSEAVAPKEH